ncbi:DUF1353 domain-containing protein [Halomonas salifodinae]|uniref:DUF1353 domain-containing protein n=1 Tax=Halomonas salifodinae TaxID=438745 RepID=A0ABW2F5Q6_9GAMM
MPFLTNLHTVAHGPGQWRLARDLIYSSARYGQLIEAPSGFVTDYASVPRLPFVFVLTGDTGHRAAVIHDYLYRHGAPQWSRRQADQIFRDALLESEPRWRAWIMWAGVRVGGWRAWHGA